MKISRVLIFVVLCLMLGVSVSAQVTDLTTLATSAQTSLTDSIWDVAPGAFTVFGIMLGIGMLWRWIRKAAKAS